MDRSIARFGNYSAFETGLECAVTRRIRTALIQKEAVTDLMVTPEQRKFMYEPLWNASRQKGRANTA